MRDFGAASTTSRESIVDTAKRHGLNIHCFGSGHGSFSTQSEFSAGLSQASLDLMCVTDADEEDHELCRNCSDDLCARTSEADFEFIICGLAPNLGSRRMPKSIC
eukprot:6472794-Amphidinium_carterae.1